MQRISGWCIFPILRSGLRKTQDKRWNVIFDVLKKERVIKIEILQKNLHVSKKYTTFAANFGTEQ